MCKSFSRDLYKGEETVKTFEMFWHEHRITPGDLIRLKQSHKEYRFSSIETVLADGTSWINLHTLDDFKIRSFSPSKIAGVIRKRSYRG